MRTLYLIDASIFIFRAYYACPPHLLDRRGVMANAVFGYGMFLCELLEQRAPSHIAVAFDGRLSGSHRQALLPRYKANRPAVPAELVRQFGVCRQLTAALGLARLEHSQHEADDLIGTLASRARQDGFRMVYVSSDKDLCQLVEGRDQFWDPGRRGWLDSAGVERSFGVRPQHIPDLLGLAGDAADNIPGVPGIGQKTATTLLAAFEGLEGVYAGLDRVAATVARGGARVRRLLEQHREQAWLSRHLATIVRDVPLAPIELRWAGADTDALAALMLPAALERRVLRLAGTDVDWQFQVTPAGSEVT